MATTRGPVVSSPAAAGAFVIAGSTDGLLYLLDESGRVLDRQALATGGIQSSPALDGADVAQRHEQVDLQARMPVTKLPNR